LLAPEVRSQTLTFARIENSPDQYIASKLLKQIYQQLNIDIRIRALPGKRSLLESSKGLVDGEVQRIYEIGPQYPDLIRVPTSFIQWKAAVFAKDHDFKINGWHDLQNYKVAMIRGMKYAELGILKGSLQRVLVLDDREAMMTALHMGVVDLAVSSKFSGQLQLKKMGIHTIYPLSPPLQMGKLYHYLHKKHATLVPKVDAIIQAMRSNGELKKLQHTYVSRMLAAVSLSATSE